MKKKRLLLILLFLLLIPAGILVISPYPRQLVFGPKIQGVPLCAWQEEVRRRHRPDDDSTFSTTFLSWFRTGHTDLKWTSLSEEEKERVYLTLLDDGVTEVRKNVAEALAWSYSPRVIPALVQLIDDSEKTIRDQAVDALCLRGREARSGLPKYVGLLGHSDGERRRQAVNLISSVKPRTKESLDLLTQALNDSDSKVRSEVRHCFASWNWAHSRVGKHALPRLREDFDSSDPMVRLEAAEAVWNIRRSEQEVLPVFRQVMQHAGAAIRRSALERLWRLKAGPGMCFDLVEIAAHDRDVEVRKAAVQVLGKCGSKAVSVLVSKLGDSNDDVKLRAVEALGALGPQAKEAAPILLSKLFSSEDPVFWRRLSTLGEWPVSALGQIKCKETIAPLIAQLDQPWQTEDSDAYFAVVQTLGEFGPDAGAAIPKLMPLLEKLGSARIVIAEALGKIGDETVVPALVKLLDDPNRFVRSSGARALGYMGPRAEEAIPALLRQLQDKEQSPRHFAVEALGKIGPKAAGAVPTLLRWARDPNAAIRRDTVAAALGNIGQESSQVVPVLVSLLEVEDLRREVIGALSKFGPQAKEAVPALVPLLEHDDETVADAAAEALAKIDPARFAKNKTQ